jgi:hypothetical protein
MSERVIKPALSGLETYNEEEFLAGLKARAEGDGDPVVQATSRLLATLVPVAMRALQDERNRGTRPPDVYLAIVSTTQSIMLSALASLMQGDYENSVAVLRNSKPLFEASIDTAIERWEQEALLRSAGPGPNGVN